MKVILISIVVMAQLAWGASKGPEKEGLTVYTARKTHLVQPLFDLYEKKTGVKIEHINGKAGGLVERLKREGKNTNADILLTVDAGNLWYAADQGLLEAIDSKILKESIPEAYRDKDGRWFGFSLRARTIFYNQTKVSRRNLSTYEALATSRWKGKLCLRTSRKVYNQSLVASFIDRMGESKTKKVIEGWVKNLAKPVYTSDSLLLKAIDNGECHVGIANTYYLARLVKENKVKNVKAYWPNQGDSGVHVNVSGGAVVKHSKNMKAAQKFLEWLSQDEAQELFAQLNDEYPVKKGINISKILKSWGPFKMDERPMGVYGQLQKKAVILMDKAQYR